MSSNVDRHLPILFICILLQLSNHQLNPCHGIVLSKNIDQFNTFSITTCSKPKALLVFIETHPISLEVDAYLVLYAVDFSSNRALIPDTPIFMPDRYHQFLRFQLIHDTHPLRSPKQHVVCFIGYQTKRNFRACHYLNYTLLNILAPLMTEHIKRKLSGAFFCVLALSTDSDK